MLEGRRLLCADHLNVVGDAGHFAGVASVASERSLWVSGPLDAAGDSAAAAPALAESEPNDAAKSADPLTIVPNAAAVSGTLANSGDVDFYSFTLTARSGVFFDVDSRDIGLSASLDTTLTVYNAAGSTVQGANNDGRDFESFTLNDAAATAASRDASLYLDLAAGSYVVRVASFNGMSSGSYQLKLTADSTYTTTVPALQSLPGSSDTLHLDFDGYLGDDAWNGGAPYTIPPYDLNGNPDEWTPLERLIVQTVWRVVADDYAPFNLNVTTSFAGAYGDGVAHRQVIGNSNGSQVGFSGALGVASYDAYSKNGAADNVSFTFASNFAAAQTNEASVGAMNSSHLARAIEMGNTCSHEFAHALTLQHYGGTNPQFTSIMHTPDFGLNRERWVAGATHTGAGERPVINQDDASVIGGAINTIGLRADDHAAARDAATELVDAGDSYAGGGVLHQVTDVDTFRFAGRGATTVRLDIAEHVGNLDGEIHLFDAAGNLIASAESDALLSATLDLTLPAWGNYYLEIRSDGGAGEAGAYDVEITTTTTPPPNGIAGQVFRDVVFDNAFDAGAGDRPLAGVVVFLDGNDDGVLDAGEPTAGSDAGGNYAFTGLADGAYRVREVAPAGYVRDAAPTVHVAGGVTAANINFGNWPVAYTGTSGGDAWLRRPLASDPTRLEIVETLAGQPSVHYVAPFSVATAITFTGAGGGDAFTVIDGPAPLAATFNGGDGNDTLIVGTTDSILTYDGGAGADALVHHDTPGTSAAIALSASALAVGAAGLVNFTSVSDFSLNGSADADDFQIGYTGAGSVTVNGAGGDDVVSLTDNGRLAGMLASFFFDGGPGEDALNARDHNGSAAATYTSTATTLDRTDFGLLTYGGFETCRVIAGSGGDTFVSTTTAAATRMIFDGRDGNDTLNLNGASASELLFRGGVAAGFVDTLNVNAGHYGFTSDAAFSTRSLQLNVNSPAGGVTFDGSSQHLHGLSIGAGKVTMAQDGARTLVTQTLAIAGGTLDLVDNDLIVLTGAAGAWDGTSYTGISGLVQRGRNGGGWDGPTGIVTSAPEARPPGSRTTLAPASAARVLGLAAGETGVWNGETVTAGSVLVKHTYAGDADLSGALDSDDYFAIDSNVRDSHVVLEFALGDFDLNGMIDTDDFFIIDSTVHNQGIGVL